MVNDVFSLPGIGYAMSLLGPAIGYVLGGQLLSIYIDIKIPERQDESSTFYFHLLMILIKIFNSSSHEEEKWFGFFVRKILIMSVLSILTGKQYILIHIENKVTMFKAFCLIYFRKRIFYLTDI